MIDHFDATSSVSSSVVKCCPFSKVFARPALEQSLVNWACSGRFAHFCSYSRNRFTCTLALFGEIWSVVDTSCGITMVSKLSSATGFPVPFEHWKFPRPILHMFPLLLRRHWADWRKQLYEESLRRFRRCHWHMFWQFSFSFALQISSFKSTGSTKNGMSALTEINHHETSDIVPFQMFWKRELRTTSFLIQAQETTNVLARFLRVSSATTREFATQASRFPVSPHTTSLFNEDLQCSESCEFFPSNSSGSVSTRSNALYWGEFINQSSASMLWRDLNWFLPYTLLNRRRPRFLQSQTELPCQQARLSFAT